jgi:hypothetical protein
MRIANSNVTNTPLDISTNALSNSPDQGLTSLPSELLSLVAGGDSIVCFPE